MKKNYTPENTALVDSFCEAIKLNAPAGVNIRTARKGETEVHIYIMNAPAPLYDFTAEDFGACVRCVKVNNEMITASPALADIWANLLATAGAWSKEHGGKTLTCPVFIGSPSQSFTPIAKDTPRPRVKAVPVVGLNLPRSISPRDASILRAMWPEVLAVLNNARATSEEYAAPQFEELAEDVRAERIIYDGDNTPRAWDFEGFTVTCEPVKLPVLFARLCKTFRATYTAPAWGLAPVEDNAPAVEVAEPSPVVEDVAPVEVSTEAETQQERPARRSLGRMAVRVVVALLLVVIAVLRVCVAALRLAERGRLGEVVRHRVAVRLRLYRARAHRVQVVAVRRVQGVRLMVLYRVEVSKERARARVVHAVEGVRRRAVVRYGRAVQRVESVRVSIVEAIGRAGRRVVQGVERVQSVTRRASGRVVQGASVATLSLVIVARRLDSVAKHLETI